MSNLVIFTEEYSAKVLLDLILPKILPGDITHVCVPFEGKQDLEKQLPIKLRGWRAPASRFVVLRDQDSGACDAIKRRIKQLCDQAGKADVLIRIVCRELESWYLADLVAVERGLDISGLAKHQQNAACRCPDRTISPANQLKKLTQGRYQKVSGSRAIGPFLDLENTRSASFKNFVLGIRSII